MQTESLWGEIPITLDVKPPVIILKEQAAILSEKTGGRLRGEVDLSHSAGKIRLDMFIVAPSLDDYEWGVLTVWHPLDLYPLQVAPGSGQKPVDCQTEEEFVQALKDVLSSRSVGRAISSLLAQSQERAAGRPSRADE